MSVVVVLLPQIRNIGEYKIKSELRLIRTKVDSVKCLLKDKYLSFVLLLSTKPLT